MSLVNFNYPSWGGVDDIIFSTVFFVTKPKLDNLFLSKVIFEGIYLQMCET